MVKEALNRRAAQLRDGRNEALSECAHRAAAAYLLDDAGKACLKGEPPTRDPVRPPPPLAARNKPGPLPELDAARDRLSVNPNDLEALRKVGRAFFDAGDYHAARLVLARIVEAGGDAKDLNLLGVTSFQSGDIPGALEALARAKAAGSPASVLNLAAVLEVLGLDKMAGDLQKEASSEVDGELLEQARALRGTAGEGR